MYQVIDVTADRLEIYHNLIAQRSMESRDKRSVFKLSGNMALGGTSSTPRVPDPPTYSNEELAAAKNSLRLLKAKEVQKQTTNSYDYQRQSSSGYSNYSGNSKYGASLPEDTYTKPRRELVSEEYKSKGNGRATFDISSGMDPEYSDYKKRDLKPQMETRKKESLSQKKYEEEFVPKATLPARRRQGQPEPTSMLDEKPIAELKGNSSSVPNQYEDENVQLMECKAGCGRSFKPSVLKTHEKVCKKVFQTKRKEFNAQQQRVVEAQLPKTSKKTQPTTKKVEPKDTKGTKQKDGEKIPKWKLQSMQFRNILKGDSQKQSMSAQQQQQLQSAIKQASGYIQCPTCNRSFNETAGKRHIPVCAQSAKKNKFRK